MGLLSFIFGYRRLTFSHSDAAELFNFCMRRALVYRRPATEGEKISVECSLRAARILERFCSESEILLESREGGLPRILGRYRRRFGILVGALLASLIIILSSRVVWEIRIEGNSRLTREEVLNELYEGGLYVGAPISGIRVDKLRNGIIARSDSISWIAVNLVGTVAHVEIREHIEPERADTPRAANLVAECDGQIELFEEVRGEPVVEIGDLVRRGELLVSGIYDSDTLGFRYTAASGRVLARVSEDFHIEIPLYFERKLPTGREFCEKYLIFFSKEIKIYSNCRNLPPKCDTIDVVEEVRISGERLLPVALRTVSYIEYACADAARTPDEAIELAHEELKRQIFEADMGDLLSKKTKATLTDSAYILDSTVESVKNIAKQVEVEVADS